MSGWSSQGTAVAVGVGSGGVALGSTATAVAVGGTLPAGAAVAAGAALLAAGAALQAAAANAADTTMKIAPRKAPAGLRAGRLTRPERRLLALMAEFKPGFFEQSEQLPAKSGLPPWQR